MITHLGTINLGDVRAIQSASMKMGFDFAKHDRPLGKPIKQRMGGRLDEWRLTFKLVHQFCDPQSVLEKIAAVCAKGDPIPLVFDYIDYQGWVTLDDVDITYKEVSDNGRPLVITGSLTLTEYTGSIDVAPTAPAVRDNSQTLANPAPVQTAMTDDVTTLLPHRQPMQHMQEALKAQHKARLMVDKIKDGQFTDTNNDTVIEAINRAVKIVNNYFASEDWYGGAVPKLPDYPDSSDTSSPTVIEDHLTSQQDFFTHLARDAASRWLA